MDSLLAKLTLKYNIGSRSKLINNIDFKKENENSDMLITVVSRRDFKYGNYESFIPAHCAFVRDDIEGGYIKPKKMKEIFDKAVMEGLIFKFGDKTIDYSKL